MSIISYVGGRQNSGTSYWSSDLGLVEGQFDHMSWFNTVLWLLISNNQHLQHFSHTVGDLMYCAGYWQVMVEVSAALEISILHCC